MAIAPKNRHGRCRTCGELVLGLYLLRATLSDNRPVRRGLVMVGIWLLGAGFAVAASYAAVARVASGVSPSSGAAMSRGAIDKELKTGTGRPGGRTTTPSSHPLSAPGGGTRVTMPTTTTLLRPSIPVAPSTTTTTSVASTTETVTTSRGGTIWTRCSASDTIVYIAAIPKNGYQRTVDVENSSGIEQEFQNGSAVSKIQAECSNGVVHAEVEEDSADN